MRPLIVDDEARSRAARIVAYAREHPYHPGDPIPGNNPRYVGHFSSYRAVFTFTVAEGITYRHLTVSVPSGKYPNPAAAIMIASDLFGFTGWDHQTIEPPRDWLGGVNEKEHCVLLMQEVKDDRPISA